MALTHAQARDLAAKFQQGFDRESDRTAQLSKGHFIRARDRWYFYVGADELSAIQIYVSPSGLVSCPSYDASARYRV